MTANSNLRAIGDSLLQQQAAQLEAGSRLRWEPHGNKIVIMRCGSKVKGKSNYVATIGKEHELYPEWEPVLMEYKRRRSANGGRRQKLGEIKQL